MWKAQGRSGEERGEKRKGQEKNRKCIESERREGSLRVKREGEESSTENLTCGEARQTDRDSCPTRPVGGDCPLPSADTPAHSGPLLTLRRPLDPGPKSSRGSGLLGPVCAVYLTAQPVSDRGWARRQPGPAPWVCLRPRLAPGMALHSRDLCRSVCDHLSECVFLCVTVSLSGRVSVCTCTCVSVSEASFGLL